MKKPKTMKGVLFAFFFFFVGIAVGWAQGFTVTGKVIDNEVAPLPT